MMRAIQPVVLLLAGAVHLLPLWGLLGPFAIARLYSVSVEDPNLEILMRHRAVTFGLIGALLVAAAFMPNLRLPAIIAGVVSTASFVLIAKAVGGYNAAIEKVVVVDVAISVLLLVGGIAGQHNRR